jgi:hypothetical protein
MFSLIGKARRTKIYEMYQEEKGGNPRVGMTTFLSLTPSNWIKPSIEKCVCSYCHEGLEILDNFEKILSLGLPDGIKQSRQGWGAHLPRTSKNQDTLDYIEAQKLIALLRHHFGEEFIEKVRRDQQPMTTRFVTEIEKGKNRDGTGRKRLRTGISFEAKNKPSNLISSATRGISTLKYQQAVLKQLDPKPKGSNEKDDGKPTKRRGRKRKKGETEESDEEEQDYLPDGQYSFTSEPACDFCNNIMKLFGLLHSLVSHFHPIISKDWVEVLRLPPPENQTPKGQEAYIKSWLYAWA